MNGEGKLQISVMRAGIPSYDWHDFDGQVICARRGCSAAFSLAQFAQMRDARLPQAASRKHHRQSQGNGEANQAHPSPARAGVGSTCKKTSKPAIAAIASAAVRG